uniref:Bcl-2 Bcl-2 homology region 1-3 domain-containing protein n=1 Tax=Anolis carolinensis TaxID=28377 RepID=A0A803STF8_ANOCA
MDWTHPDRLPEIEKQTFRIIQSYLNLAAGKAPKTSLDTEICISLQKMNELDARIFPIISPLQLDTPTQSCEILQHVMQQTFSDGKINWGRIFSIILFGCILVRKMPYTEVHVDNVAECIAAFLLDHESKWLCRHGGLVKSYFSFFLGTWGEIHECSNGW